jgi:hypothetical protein
MWNPYVPEWIPCSKALYLNIIALLDLIPEDNEGFRVCVVDEAGGFDHEGFNNLLWTPSGE